MSFPETIRRRLFIGGILALGGVLSFFVWSLARHAEEARIESEFNRRAGVLARLAREHLRLHVELVHGIRAFFESAHSVGPEEFEAYCASLSNRLPAANVFEWSPRVAANEREAFERRQRERVPGFRIWERDVPTNPATAAVPARARAEYWPITYVSPAAPHVASFGFDLYASVTTRPMLEAARASRTLQLSPHVPLIRDPKRPRGEGVIFMEPVFRPGAPASGPDGFFGFIQAIFHIDVLLGGVLAEDPDPALNFEIFDDSAYNPRLQLLYGWRDGAPVKPPAFDAAGGPEMPQPVTSSLHASTRDALVEAFEIGGRQWRIVVTMNPAWGAEQATATPVIVLLAWLGLTALATFFIRNLLLRTALVETRVRQRTAELAESQRKLDSFFHALPGVAYRGTYDGKLAITFVSEGAVALTEYEPSEFVAGGVKLETLIHPDDQGRVRAAALSGWESSREVEVEFRVRTRSGDEKWVLSRGRAVRGAGEPSGFEGLAIDITAQKQAEADRLLMERKLYESQKLESLGVLAGGVAHDFNNLLTGVMGNAGLARLRSRGDPSLERYLNGIEYSAQRAADLCRQMLAYAGKGNYVVEPLDLTQLVSSMASLLSTSAAPRADVQISSGPRVPLVLADATQIRQIVLNLVLNAAEAIGAAEPPELGQIHVLTGVMNADAQYLAACAAEPGLTPGEYAILEVRDNGCGMNAELLARIFDPFYSTKFTGRGLGLAAVLGIVRSHHGALHVESAPGRGAIFRVLLPPAKSAAAELGSGAAVVNGSTGWRGNVLVVDDEEPVRVVTAEALEALGLTARLAGGGREAIDLLREGPGAYDLVMLDLTMPGFGGERTLAEIRALRSEIPVLLMSGYGEGNLMQRLAGAHGRLAFLAKPFSTRMLSEKLRELLPSPPTS